VRFRGRINEVLLRRLLRAGPRMSGHGAPTSDSAR
jgi:hypothetical protein